MVAANDVASVIISRAGTWLDAMKLQKLLYYSQAWHVAIAGSPLFDEPVEAWRDGPVVAPVWQLRKDQPTRRPREQDVSRVQLDELSSSIVDLVVSTYGALSGQELSALTHVEGPWCEAREGVAEGARSRNVIPLESMARFYRTQRMLGGRTAADLAAGGVYLRADGPVDAIDVDALLGQLGDDVWNVEDSPWGSTNLAPVDDIDFDDVEAGPEFSFRVA